MLEKIEKMYMSHELLGLIKLNYIPASNLVLNHILNLDISDINILFPILSHLTSLGTADTAWFYSTRSVFLGSRYPFTRQIARLLVNVSKNHPSYIHLLAIKLNLSLSDFIVQLFFETDDQLILIMIQIIKTNSLELDIFPVFHSFSRLISFDYKILLDYLISPETEFLLFLLLFCKYCINPSNRKNVTSSIDYIKVIHMLSELRDAIVKINGKNLFPYSPDALVKRLDLLLKHFPM